MTLDLLHLTDPAVAHADDFKDDPSFSCFDVELSGLDLMGQVDFSGKVTFKRNNQIEDLA